jgi:hypothetical protein
MDPPLHKTPPKTSERIRAALESVRRDEQPAAGPYKHGLAAEEPLLIATFRDHECCRRYQEALLRSGVMSQVRKHRTGAEVLVDYSDRDKAYDVLKTHLAEFPDLPRADYRRDFDFTIFGTVLGATFGAILLLAEFRDVQSLVILLLFTVLGAVTGSFLDRPRNRYRRTGQIQFGLGDVLVLTAIVALGLVLWEILHGWVP